MVGLTANIIILFAERLDLDRLLSWSRLLHEVAAGDETTP